MQPDIRHGHVLRLCERESCQTPFYARNRSVAKGQGRFCSNAYRFEWMAETAVDRAKKYSRSVEERFWSKVDKSGECWLWLGAKGDKGHGLFWFAGRQDGAHRVSYILAHGPIPDGFWVLHNCPDGDEPSCVRPAHLWLGTVTDNNRDMFAKGRGAVGDNHPARSHGEYLPRGDGHWTRQHPERVPRGTEHAFAKNPQLAARGEASGQSKLTEDQVREARRLVASGESKRSVAIRFGVSPHIIARIIAGTAWKHVR
jgi:hypothetical protein